MKNRGSLRLQNLDHVVNEVTPLWALQALLFTRFGEWLAREACTQNVMSGNQGNFRAANVTVWIDAEVLSIQRRQIGIDL